jgi:hypothetical protein
MAALPADVMNLLELACCVPRARNAKGTSPGLAGDGATTTLAAYRQTPSSGKLIDGVLSAIKNLFTTETQTKGIESKSSTALWTGVISTFSFVISSEVTRQLNIVETRGKRDMAERYQNGRASAVKACPIDCAGCHLNAI